MTTPSEHKTLLRGEAMALMHGLTAEIANIQIQGHSAKLVLSLLASRFERILQLMTNKDYAANWPFLMQDLAVYQQVVALRDQAAGAMAAFEKHQANHDYVDHSLTHGYFGALSTALSQEVALGCLDERSNLVFIGSGAMPTTALYLTTVIGTHVCCHDIDEEAQAIASRWITQQGMAHKISLTHTNEALQIQLQQASHIMIASLVPEKVKLLNQLHPLCKAGTKVFIRHGEGIKTLFNYPFFRSELHHHWHCLSSLNDQILYDVDLLVRAK